MEPKNARLCGGRADCEVQANIARCAMCVCLLYSLLSIKPLKRSGLDEPYAATLRKLHFGYVQYLYVIIFRLILAVNFD